MFGKSAFLLAALFFAASAAAEGPKTDPQANIANGASATGGQSYGDRNLGGPYGFYSYPRHRHVDGGGSLDRRPLSETGGGTSPYCDTCHGSAYYGRDYGAPYFGGGYYDRGVYYRERRD